MMHTQIAASIHGLTKTGFRTRSVITVPLRCKNNKILGVIQAVNKKSASSFNRDDLELFQTFASMVSVSLENAQLVADLRRSLEQERRLAVEKEKLGAFLPKVVVDEVSRSRETKLALGGRLLRRRFSSLILRGLHHCLN